MRVATQTRVAARSPRVWFAAPSDLANGVMWDRPYAAPESGKEHAMTLLRFDLIEGRSESDLRALLYAARRGMVAAFKAS